jgi:hypothetical protein
MLAKDSHRIFLGKMGRGHKADFFICAKKLIIFEASIQQYNLLGK